MAKNTAKSRGEVHGHQAGGCPIKGCRGKKCLESSSSEVCGGRDKGKVLVANTTTPNPQQPSNKVRDELLKLAHHKSQDFRVYVARHPDASSEILEHLATDPSDNVRKAVAKNPKTPKHCLLKLSEDYSADIGATLLANPSLPEETHSKLVHHPSYKVRENLASVTKDESLLKLLAKDSELLVRCAVARHSRPNTPVGDIIASDPNLWVRKEMNGLSSLFSSRKYEDVIDDPNIVRQMTDPTKLSSLASDSAWEIRSEVALNCNTPIESLYKLADDSNHRVRFSVALNTASSPQVLLKVLKNESDNNNSCEIIAEHSKADKELRWL